MSATISADLAALKDKFNAWRQTRANARTPIPDELWQMASSLLDRYPASTIASLCRLHPTSLKKHATSQTSSALRKQKPSAQAFFHLPAPDRQKGSLTPPPSTSSYRLQIERPDGSRLTLSLPALDQASINTLCASFLRS